MLSCKAISITLLLCLAQVEKSCLNCRVLELGAGCGAVGMFLSIFKGCEAWLTEAGWWKMVVPGWDAWGDPVREGKLGLKVVETSANPGQMSWLVAESETGRHLCFGIAEHPSNQ